MSSTQTFVCLSPHSLDSLLNRLYQEMAVDYLMTKLPNEDNIDDELKQCRDNGAENHEKILKLLEERGTAKKVRNEDVDTIFGLSESKLTEKKAPVSRKKGSIDTNEDDISTPPSPAKPTARGRGRGRGAARGSRARGASTSGRAMPQLDISMGSKPATRQPTLLDAMNQKSSRTRAAPKIVYDISSDSE